MGATLANLTNKLLRAPLTEALCGYTLWETNAEPLQRLGHSKLELKLNTAFSFTNWELLFLYDLVY